MKPMHCLTAFIIGIWVWVLAFAYTFFDGGNWVAMLITAPMVISGVTAMTLAVDYMLSVLMSAITKFLTGDATAFTVVEDAYELESTTGKGNQKR
jgi:hypothetical protein